LKEINHCARKGKIAEGVQDVDSLCHPSNPNDLRDAGEFRIFDGVSRLKRCEWTQLSAATVSRMKNNYAPKDGRIVQL
jgi:hypothetical protein